jgi:hypothetical protein
LAKNFSDDEIKDGSYRLRILRDEDITEVSCKLYYNVMIVATENPLTNKNIKLYLCSYDNEGVRLYFIFKIMKFYFLVS